MKSKLKCWLFITGCILAVTETVAQPTVLPGPVVTLPSYVGEFYLHSFYKWQRDSTLLSSSQEREKSLTVAVATLQEKVKTYQADSTDCKGKVSALNKIRTLSIDSVATRHAEKESKLKSRSVTKGWIITGLVTIIVVALVPH